MAYRKRRTFRARRSRRSFRGRSRRSYAKQRTQPRTYRVVGFRM